MWTLLALTTTVWAQQDAYYHSNQIAEASQVFAAAAEASAPQFQTAQTQVGRYSMAMEELEIGTLMAAQRLSDSDHERSELVRRRIMQAYMQTARHVDLLQTDYETIFTDALERALAQDLGDYTITECGATGIAALTGQSSCNGVSLNEAIAAIIDKDTELSAAVNEINGIPWPLWEIPSEAQAALPLLGDAGSDTLLISGSALASAFMRERVQLHQDALDRALAPLEEGLESSDPDALARAQELRAGYESSLSRDGSVLLTTVEASLERVAKKQGLSSVALCINPEVLGGCEGTDQTKSLIGLLTSDRRFVKALGALDTDER